MPGARRRVSYFMGHFFERNSALLPRKRKPLKVSGTRFFDNCKAGNFMPTTSGRLRSAGRIEGMIYYKFCSSMLSSTVDLQGELSQAPGISESRVQVPAIGTVE